MIAFERRLTNGLLRHVFIYVLNQLLTYLLTKSVN